MGGGVGVRVEERVEDSLTLNLSVTLMALHTGLPKGMGTAEDQHPAEELRGRDEATRVEGALPGACTEKG